MTQYHPSLDGRTFRAVSDVDGGEVSTETVFEYHQDGDLVWAEYSGGTIRRGHLVGTRHGDRLDFRYAQLNTAGETAAGHCVSTVESGPGGRLRLHETWEWESKAGSGTSVVEEQ
ncbi:hypothetical protein [Longispora albida]|uniref:hypothetical protein n=1 Tax=Longispora albida TaxID=203523 RepID=UPI000377415F|nr:hypothetical protein [Longispora albida]